MDSFLDSIEKKIKKLSFKHRVLFTALTCEKMLPSYTLFSSQEKWGNTESLEEAIIILFQFLQNIKLSDSEIELIYEKVEENTPHTDEFDNGLASYAFDACVVLGEAIEHLLSKEIENALNVASAARDTVDMFVQELESLDPNDKELESKIAQNEYMIREVQRQHTILDRLLSEDFNIPLIATMRELNNRSGTIVDLPLIY